MKTKHWVLSMLLIVGYGISLVNAVPPEGRGPNKGGNDGGDTESTVDHKAKQNAPIQLGTSGGWADDLANGYCCGGTLGALVKIGSNKFILSNYHVLAADIVSGGNGYIAAIDTEVIHPGLIDIGCNRNNGIVVADLAQAALPLVDPNNNVLGHDLGTYMKANVDAALALVVPGMVDSSGSILEIGELSSWTVAASLNQRVKKSGRTTGLSKSRIVGIGYSVSVSYENECAGGGIGTAVFTNQIVIDNKGSKYLAGGDSGSVMVEDRNDNPRAIGLLYAGSSRYAIANPIDEVLSTFGATMVGVDTGEDPNVIGSSGSSALDGQIANARAAQRGASASLLNTRGVVGHGISLGANGQPVIQVLVESMADYDRGGVPPFIDGVRVVVVESGKIVAF